jgi:signal peptidase II
VKIIGAVELALVLLFWLACSAVVHIGNSKTGQLPEASQGSQRELPTIKICMSPNRARIAHFFIAMLVVLIDRWTKHLAATRIAMYSHIQIIPGFFRLTHTENTGAAFSLFAESPAQWKTGMLIGFSVVAMVIVTVLLWKQAQALTITGIALSLILGGAMGNLWDRVARGRVVDFLLVYVKQYQWPVFNLADSAIVMGASLLMLEFIRPNSASDHS